MQKLEFNKTLKQYQTTIPGLIIYDLTVLGDNRGWFKENWQREKMLAIGLPDFGPVQNNFSFNSKRGTMRGIHAEPWDKFISVGSGSFLARGLMCVKIVKHMAKYLLLQSTRQRLFLCQLASPTHT